MPEKNAESVFCSVYLPKVLDAKYPPKAYVRLEDMDIPERNCPELTQRTADAIDDIILHELFISTQRNNLGLCAKAALQHILVAKFDWEDVILAVLVKFPHFWMDRKDESVDEVQLFGKGKRKADNELKKQKQGFVEVVRMADMKNMEGLKFYHQLFVKLSLCLEINKQIQIPDLQKILPPAKP